MAIKIDATNILLKNIINAIQDVKGNEIISLDLREIESTICKYFVICTGTSNTHVNSIEGNVKKAGRAWQQRMLRFMVCEEPCRTTMDIRWGFIRSLRNTGSMGA